MLMLPSSVRMFVATQPVDGRRGCDGLAGMVREVFGQDPLGGHLFVFFSRRRTSVRILFWDRSGWCLFSKRLERGVFRLPEQIASGANGREIDVGELTMILEGIELRDATRRARWTPATANHAA